MLRRRREAPALRCALSPPPAKHKLVCRHPSPGILVLCLLIHVTDVQLIARHVSEILPTKLPAATRS